MAYTRRASSRRAPARRAAATRRRPAYAARTRRPAKARGRRTGGGQTIRFVIEQANPTATHRPSYLSSLNPAVVETARKRLAKL